MQTHIDLLSENEYYKIYDGQRLTKKQLEPISDGMKEPVIVFSSSEFDEHVLGYIELEKLKEIKPNQRIFTGESVLLNTGGSVGKVRYKNLDQPYTVKDCVVIFKFDKDNSHAKIFYNYLIKIFKNRTFDYTNNLVGDKLRKQKIKIPIKSFSEMEIINGKKERKKEIMQTLKAITNMKK